jgi:7-carboxy-7-deazaguanine synthase
MRCAWCDSEYTFTGGEQISIEEVLKQVRDFGCQLVEVTGGEPLAQREAFELIKRLCDEKFEVLVETGGYVSTEDLDQRARVILDVKCPASGEAERNHWPNLTRLRPELDEVKFVVADRADWNFAREVVDDYNLESRTRSILISPAWEQIDLPELANWILESGMNARMQLQMHKYIWGPDARGV